MPDIKRNPMASGQFEEMGQSNPTYQAAPKSGGYFGKAIAIVVVILVILAGLFLISKYTSLNIFGLKKEAASVSLSGWQAVFLSNGQVYFGRISKISSDSVVLKDVYYLQVTQQIQPADQQAQAQQQAQGSQQQPNVSLVKLGNELHGPKDEMMINRTHVLFTEELKEDSKVVDAIKRYVEDNAKK